MDSSRILLVEDNLQEVELTLRALRRNNIRNNVPLVRDGAEALDFLFCQNAYSTRDPHDLPQFVIMDLNMPKLNGAEVLRILRRNPVTRLIPVVILSTSIEETGLVRSYENGSNSFLRKPVDYDEFVDTIGKAAIYWLDLNQTPQDPRTTNLASDNFLPTPNTIAIRRPVVIEELDAFVEVCRITFSCNVLVERFGKKPIGQDVSPQNDPWEYISSCLSFPTSGKAHEEAASSSCGRIHPILR
jgi:CheY-like chemotaxis protein